MVGVVDGQRQHGARAVQRHVGQRRQPPDCIEVQQAALEGGCLQFEFSIALDGMVDRAGPGDAGVFHVASAIKVW